MVISFLIGFILGGSLLGFWLYQKLVKQLHQERLNSTRLDTQYKAVLAENLRHKELVSSEHQYIEKELSQHFELLAHRLLDEKTKKMNEQNEVNLSAILNPVKEKLKEFEQKVEQSYSAERTERGILRGELNKLLELNQVMSREASNLTRALKGENKTQGNWGEMILENILERSGLRKGEEFVTQGTEMNLRNEHGEILKPDVVIQLPEGKHLIIDSKMTLQAYEQYSSFGDEPDRDRWAKSHVDSLKRHIDGLSSKEYHLADKLISPDFVMLFMPIEPAFALAFRVRPELFQYAWDKNVAIVSPTTLLSTLRTVATLWRQDRQEKNAIEIAKRGGLLYDKFVGVLKDIEILGDKLDSAQKSHQDLVSKISSGRGNLIDQVSDLKRLGAKAEKQIKFNQAPQKIETEPLFSTLAAADLSEDLLTLPPVVNPSEN